MPAAAKESGVLRACEDLLTAEGIFWRRWNVGAIKAGNRFFRFGQKGDADILAFPKLLLHTTIMDKNGKNATPGYSMWIPVPLWIECKRLGGKLTEHQLRFADEVRNKGHYHLVVPDVMVLQNWLREHRAR